MPAFVTLKTNRLFENQGTIESGIVSGDTNGAFPEPSFRTSDVNLKGMLITAHLALAVLSPPDKGPKNPKAEQKSKRTSSPGVSLLLVGPMASLVPLPALALYAGCFRARDAGPFPRSSYDSIDWASADPTRYALPLFRKHHVTWR